MIALLNTGFSNLKAYENVLKKLGLVYVICSSGEELSEYDVRVILLPGVSNFGALSRELHNRKLVQKILDFVSNGAKLIGTCSGMQILFEESDESPGYFGLGLIKGRVRQFQTYKKSNINVGWKPTVTGEYFFVHGYYCEVMQDIEYASYSTFGKNRFLSEFSHKNVIGFQYHPEKSGVDGLKRLREVLFDDVKIKNRNILI